MLNKLLASSVDPEELSLTVKGLLLSSVPLVMLIVQAAGTHISQNQLREVIVAIADSVAALGTLVSASMVAAGMVRKLFIALHG